MAQDPALILTKIFPKFTGPDDMALLEFQHKPDKDV